MLVGAVMGFWSVQRFHANAGVALAAGDRRRGDRRRGDGLDPRVPRDHAAREPDRLGARADDLRRRRRALVLPRQRPEPRRRSRPPTRSTPSSRRGCSAGRSSARSCSGRTSSSTSRGARGRDLATTSTARGRASTSARSASRRPPPTRWGSTSPRYRYVHTIAGGALAGVAGATITLAITPQWVDGITGGAGWIAIALVIFAFWRPELCLVGAYFFGALQALAPELQARQISLGPTVLWTNALPYVATIVVLVDRLGRHGAPPARRSGRARQRRTRARSADGCVSARRLDASASRSASPAWSRTTASTSRPPRARCTRCSARTARGSRPSRTSSPASTARTRGRSPSTASGSTSRRRARRSTRGSGWCTSTSASSSGSASRRTSCSATGAAWAARSASTPAPSRRRCASSASATASASIRTRRSGSSRSASSSGWRSSRRCTRRRAS